MVVNSHPLYRLSYWGKSLSTAGAGGEVIHRHACCFTYKLELVLRCKIPAAGFAGRHLECPTPDRPRILGGLHLDMTRGAHVRAGAAADAGGGILPEGGTHGFMRTAVR